MALTETYRPAFTDPPASILAGIPARDLQLLSPDVTYGGPFPDVCAKHVRDTFKRSRVYIIVSGTLSRETDELDRLVAAIRPERVVGVRKGVKPHTPWSNILEIAADARKVNADCIVTLGAGSITDCAKIVVLALANSIETPEQLARYSVESTDVPDKVEVPTVPLITIPTTLSGGEYFSLGGGTDDRTHHKQGFLHSGMGSQLVILDASLSKHTPVYHWLSTGIRSVDHCVEALCSFDSTSESDVRAEAGLRKLVPNLLRTKNDPSDVEARHQCQMGVIFAMNNVRSGIPMGGSHAIGHQLGPLGVPHGVTSCILCPTVMKYNARYGHDNELIIQKQEKLREILWSEEIPAAAFTKAGLKKDSADLGDLLDVIIRALELPRTLTEMEVKADILPALSERALDDFWAATNPIPLIKSEQVLEILKAAL